MAKLSSFSEKSEFTALVVDDEALARKSIKTAISFIDGWSVVAECDNGLDVINAVRKFKPDVIFLDIQMHGKSGLDVCKLLHTEDEIPFVVFITAYERYAIQAFELCAFDYLLKPFSDARLLQTVERIEGSSISQQSKKAQISLLSDVTQELNRAIDKLIVRSVGKIQLIEISDILWISSAGNYVELHLADKIILHRISLNYLEDVLPSGEFVRVHRKSIIRMSEVCEFLTVAESTHHVVLRSGDEVAVSQKYKQELMIRLGVG